MSEGSVIDNNYVGAITNISTNDCTNSQFPVGMRVLVVDDNIVCLKVITALLQKCLYQVTAKENSTEALMLLKQNEDKFDIVLTDVKMAEIDGFKLLEAGLEHDIPVIMISASDDIEIIKKGVRHGARDYLVKPVRLPEIQIIWKHVYRKNLKKSPNINNENTLIKRGVVRKIDSTNVDDDDNVEPVSKRERIRWSQPLHDKFVDAVAKLGGEDKAVPKKILELMGEKDITREKVASHLQKYRKAIKKNFVVDHNISSSCTTTTTNVTRGLQVGAIDQYAQLNNPWMTNYQISQPRSIQVRPNQLMIQQQQQQQQQQQNQMIQQQQQQYRMHGSQNSGQVMHHFPPAPQHNLSYEDYRLLGPDSFNVERKVQMNDGLFDNRMLTANSFLFDGSYNALLEEILR